LIRGGTQVDIAAIAVPRFTGHVEQEPGRCIFPYIENTARRNNLPLLASG